MSDETYHCPTCKANTIREGWRSGPWDAEPNYVPAFQHAGLNCILHRGGSGAWYGYVGVPPGHPAHGKDYGDVPVEVHWGLTCAAECHHGCVCHAPAPGEPKNLWWLGFDCGHYGDEIPAYEIGHGGEYRTLEYATAETEALARQLAAMTTG